MVPGEVGGAILAGGASRRFGSDKALAPAPKLAMGACVARALRGAGIDPVVMIGGSAEAAGHLNLILIPDQFPDEGPLGATATALNYFTSSHVLVTACDLPLLTAGDVIPLVDSLVPGQATVSAVAGEPQLSLACWPRVMYRSVLGSVRAGKRRWDTLLDLTPFTLIEIRPDALADADDPQTLAELLRGVDP